MQRNVQIRFIGYSETFVYEIVFWLITLLNIYFVKIYIFGVDARERVAMEDK